MISAVNVSNKVTERDENSGMIRKLIVVRIPNNGVVPHARSAYGLLPSCSQPVSYGILEQ